MQSDDRWHGSEDYPGPAPGANFDQWEQELQEPTPFPVYWNGFDTWLRRMLFGGLVALVWVIVFGLIMMAVKGDI